MRRLIIAAALLTAVAAPSSAGQPQDALQLAIAVAKAHAAQRYAFTATYRNLAEEGSAPLAVRFDPRREEGERWTPVAPEGASLSKEQRKQLKNLNKTNDADGALVYEGLAASLPEVTLVSETEEEAVFDGPVTDPERSPALRKAATMTITLDKTGGYVGLVEVRAKEPFKPAKVARVDRLHVTQRYEPAAAGGPALLRRSETLVSGEAMFQAFDQHIRVDYFDIEAVDAAPFAGAN